MNLPQRAATANEDDFGLNRWGSCNFCHFQLLDFYRSILWCVSSVRSWIWERRVELGGGRSEGGRLSPEDENRFSYDEKEALCLSVLVNCWLINIQKPFTTDTLLPRILLRAPSTLLSAGASHPPTSGTFYQERCAGAIGLWPYLAWWVSDKDTRLYLVDWTQIS